MRRLRNAAICGAVLSLWLTASAGAAARIDLYTGSIPGDASPESILTGPDGNLWAGEIGSSGALFRVTPAGLIGKILTGGGTHPLDLATGPEGRVWFTAHGTSRLGVVNPLTEEITEHPFATNFSMEGIVGGPGGALWVAVSSPNAAILRVAPSEAAGELANTAIAVKASSQPDQLTVGAEGDVWFTENAGPGAIGRLTPATGEVREFTEGLTSNSRPAGITTGPEGDIWFTESAGSGRIGRLVPATGRISEYSTGLTIGAPQRIVTGDDGNLYFTASEGNGAIGRITPAGVITEYGEGLAGKPEPWGITSGPDGNIWFTLKANPSRVGRLTLAPGISSSAATSVTSRSATLTASVRANAQSTSYHFEYGTDAAYGSRTATTSAGAAGTPLTVSASVSGLAPATTYHFRVIAENATGTTYGADNVFTTQGTGAAGPRGAGPAPVIGKLAGVEPLSGSVRFQNSHGAFVALTRATTLPVGAVIDTTHGVVKVLTALPARGRTQALKVWGGIFRVAQSRHGNGLTRILLKTPLACRRHGRAHAASRRRGVRTRTLWAKDSNGRYSTYGANSVATVLGTEWETVDSCAGTLTRVLQGRVRVRNSHTHRTILVSAGHSYLARP